MPSCQQEALSFPVPPPDCFQSLVDGRAVSLSFSSSAAKCVEILFVHNFGLSTAITSQLVSRIKQAKARCDSNPSSHALCLFGDFNLTPRGSSSISLLDSATISGAFKNRVLPRPHEHTWNALFDQLIEVDFPIPSHINSASLSLSRINRMFVSLPRSAVSLVKFSAGIRRDPAWYEAKRLSDHAPIFMHLSVFAPKPRQQLRLKPQWCKDPAFKQRLDALCAAVNWEALTLDEQSITLKEFQRDAALFVRDKLFAQDPEDPQCVLMRLSSIARCVWMCDLKLYKILITHSDLAKLHLTLDHGAPALADPTGFEEDVRRLKEADFGCQRKSILNESHSSASQNPMGFNRKKNKLNTVDRLAALWLPKAPRIIIIGSRLNNEEALTLGLSTTGVPTDTSGNFLYTAADHLKIVSHFWKRVFGESKPEPPEHMVDTFLCHYDSSKWDWNKAHQFSQHLAELYIASLRHTGTGKDGIHNYCFKFGNVECVRFIVRLFDAFCNGAGSVKTPCCQVGAGSARKGSCQVGAGSTFCNGENLPLDINDGLFVFLQKNDKDDDKSLSAEGIYRHPGDLRPLTLKNADNKCVAGICNWIIKPVVETAACSLQNGFTKGRIFLNNVIDLDATARIDALDFCGIAEQAGLGFGASLGLAHKDLVNVMPVLMLFDYLSAFPSVSHAWIFYVLTFLNIPSGLLALVRNLYNSNKAFFGSDSGWIFVFYILSGVLQGCPLSGSLFVIVIDPLLNFFKIHLENSALATCRACADDIGIALRHMACIPSLHKWFSEYSVISGLVLNPGKCIIVLTTFLANTDNQNTIRDWLSAVCPSWRDMKICNAAKYLGFFLGPLATPQQWPKALAKFQDRISSIHTGRLPAALCRVQFMSRALPTLGYVAQLVEAPRDIVRIGLNSVIKVMRLAGNSVSYRAAFSMDSLGGPNFPDISVYLRSCLIRTACKTLSGYESLNNSLMLAGTRSLSFAMHRYAHAIPPGWDGPAFCSTLVKASSELPQELCRSGDGPPLSGSLQARIYKLLCVGDEAKFLAWRRLLGDRACMLCEDIEEDSCVLSLEQFSRVRAVLLTLGHGPRLCAIKTLINSWATSCRMGEKVDLPCFFCGEDMEDDLDHYLACDTFWTLLISSARLGSLGTSFLSLPPSHRLGVLHPTSLSFKLLAGAYLVYHALKLEHIEVVKDALSSGDLSSIHLLTISLAELHYSDLIKQSDLVMPCFQGPSCLT